MMICDFPPLIGSIFVFERITTLPRPVSYACSNSSIPWIIPPVGKSGPFKNCINSFTVALGWSIA